MKNSFYGLIHGLFFERYLTIISFLLFIKISDIIFSAKNVEKVTVKAVCEIGYMSFGVAFDLLMLCTYFYEGNLV